MEESLLTLVKNKFTQQNDIQEAQILLLADMIQDCELKEIQQTVDKVIDLDCQPNPRSVCDKGNQKKHPSIKWGLYDELDQLRVIYNGLDNHMTEKLIEELELISQIESVQFPDFMKKVRMTMIPSIGYFLVVPKFGPKWAQFKQHLS